jgi:class 3 adenylate cyclase/DNA-binding NarL/FixJ family response regulator
MSAHPADDAVLPRGTVTFLFTDVEGSTRLAARLGPRYGDVLVEHQRLLRQAFADAGGRELDTQGDAFFVVFERAKDAVAAALAAQRALARHSWPDGVKVRVRMGLHTGEPSAVRDRYVGLGVHRAARICAAGHGGQILLSSSTHAVLADDLPRDLTFRDLGEHRLKDLEHPERIYQLVAPDLPTAFAPPQTLTSAPARGLRLVVADDSVLIREGLARLLSDAGFEVVARATDAEGLLVEIGRADADVAITDIKMPPAHTDEGIAAAAEIRRLHPDVGVLVLSQYLDSSYALRLLEEYPAGVGYLLKDRVYDVAVLEDAIRRVAEGECVVDPTIVSRLLGRARREGPWQGLVVDERRIVTLVAEGRSNDAIARELGLALGEVDRRLRSVFAKLGLTGAPDDVRRVVAVLEYLRST